MSEIKSGDEVFNRCYGRYGTVVSKINDLNHSYIIKDEGGNRRVWHEKDLILSLHGNAEKKEGISMREIVTLNDHRKEIQVTTTTKDKYPCLMYHTINELNYTTIVMFTDYKVGFVVGGNSPHNPIGVNRNEWYMPNFKPYDKELVIKND